MVYLMLLLHASLFPTHPAQEQAVHGKQLQNCHPVWYKEVYLHFEVLFLRTHPLLVNLMIQLHIHLSSPLPAQEHVVHGRELHNHHDTLAQEVDLQFRVSFSCCPVAVNLMILLYTKSSLSLAAQELAVCGMQFQNRRSAPDSEILSNGKETVHAILSYLLSRGRKFFLCLDHQFDHVALVAQYY